MKLVLMVAFHLQILLISMLQGQTLPPILFQRTIGSEDVDPNPSYFYYYNNSITSILPTNDDGCLIVTNTDFDSYFKPIIPIATQSGKSTALKLDKSGALQWYKKYGGSKSNFLTDAIQLNSGGYMLVGSTNSSDGDIHEPNQGSTDAWVLVLDQSGDVISSKTYGTSKIDHLRQLLDVQGKIFAFGSIDGIPAYFDYNADDWIVSLDSTGNMLSEVIVPVDSAPGFQSATLLENNDILITDIVHDPRPDTVNINGDFNNRFYVIDANSSIKYNRTVPDDNVEGYLTKVYEYPFGYIGTGTYNADAQSGDYVPTLVFFDKDFNQKYSKNAYGAPYEHDDSGFIRTKEGKILLISAVQNFEHTSWHPLLICYESNLAEVWRKELDITEKYERIGAMCATYSGSGYWAIGGRVTGVDSLGYWRNLDMLVTRFSNPPAAEINACAEIGIHPNPASISPSITTGVFPGEEVAYFVYDTGGRLVSKSKIDITETSEISLTSEMAAGVYFIKMVCASGSSVKKFVWLGR